MAGEALLPSARAALQAVSDGATAIDARELPPLGEHLPDFAAMGADMAAAGVEIVGPPITD